MDRHEVLCDENYRENRSDRREFRDEINERIDGVESKIDRTDIKIDTRMDTINTAINAKFGGLTRAVVGLALSILVPGGGFLVWFWVTNAHP